MLRVNSVQRFHQQGGNGATGPVCPVPHPHEGWDESFPPSIAVPEWDAWLRVGDFGKLLMLFNRHATASEIDSDPGVIERRFRE